MTRYSQKAFTMVELVVTIVLVGIIAAFAMSRLLDGNSFNPAIVRDQIISMARVAQQAALGRPAVSLTITPNPSADTVTLAVADSGGNIGGRSATLSLDSASLSGDINKTASCEADSGDTAITSANPLVLNFGELGDLADSGIGAGVAPITSAIRICINNSSADSVCVSPAGFAYGGNCDI